MSEQENQKDNRTQAEEQQGGRDKATGESSKEAGRQTEQAQRGAADTPRSDDERTGEGTGARGGEYS